MNRWRDLGVSDQTGRRAVVTGANAGLGYQTALALAGAGAEVVMGVRDLDRGQEAAQRIRERIELAKVRVMLLDLGDLSSVREFAAAQLEAGPVDLLVNNAGLMLVPRRELTVDGFESHMGVNHLGHYALTAQLLPALLAAPSGRVVSVTSLMLRTARRLDHGLGLGPEPDGPYSPSVAYAQSKLAVALFATELERRLRAADSTVSSVLAHPGWSATGGRRPAPAARSVKRPVSVRLASRATALFGTSARTGARPQVYAATAPDLTGGVFVGPRFGMHGGPRPITPPSAVTDPTQAAWLWAESARLTGVEPKI